MERVVKSEQRVAVASREVRSGRGWLMAFEGGNEVDAGEGRVVV
jgi:hypothetical protein